MKFKFFITALVSLLMLQAPIYAKHAGPTPGDTESMLWIVGDSSLHAYSSTAHQIKLDFGSLGKSVIDQLKTGKLTTLRVTVPVKEMKSGKDALDKNMQKALKADDFPNIVFELNKYEIIASSAPAASFSVRAMGTLEVAGVKKDAVVEGSLTSVGSGVRIQGVHDVLMTDHGIKPPKILLIKTSNEVKVHFDLKLDEKGEMK